MNVMEYHFIKTAKAAIHREVAKLIDDDNQEADLLKQAETVLNALRTLEATLMKNGENIVVYRNQN